MVKNLFTVLITASALVIAGCATNDVGQKEQTGAVVGGVLGGLLGSQVGDGRGRTAAIIAGTLIGASIGGAVGRSMDATDRMYAAQSLENTRTGVATEWRNPDTGYDYQFTPTRTYETDSGPCREFTMNATIDGRQERVYGTACRQPDGSWRIM